MLYEQFSPLRRFLLGSQFVEGTWIEFIIADKHVISMGIVSIDSRGYELQIHGYNYDIEGNLCYDFSTQPGMVKMEWPVLRYAYENRPFQGTETSVEGVAHLKFGITGSQPTMYIGSFTHIGTKILVGIEGRLVTKAEDLKALKDPTQVRGIFKKYLKQWQNEVNTQTGLTDS